MLELLQALIQIPSENNGVTGYEKEIQLFYRNWLENHAIMTEWIEPETIPGFDRHPARLRENNMHNRPVVVARMKGCLPGKNRLLLAHADTVPVGDLQQWHDSPFSGKRENGRIYGRGSGDDKWGMAVMAALAVELQKRKWNFPGTLTIASVPDEEAGGGNGTAAVLALGIDADEAIYLDGGSNQSIWHAGLGGGFCLVSEGDPHEIRQAIRQTKEEIRERLLLHPCFGEDFFRIIAAQFFLVSETAEGIRFLHDTLPGEEEEALRHDFERKLPMCRFRWMSRFLQPALVPKDSELVLALARSFHRVTGREVPVVGGVQSDQGLLTTYGKIPCILFGCGRRGLPGAAHLPDEFIEEQTLLEVYETVKDYILNP